MTAIRWATNSANWDASTTNWVDNSVIPVAYADGDAVQFEDSQSGTASPITVTMSSTYLPVSVLVNNSTKVFTITSTGVGGTTALTKQGTATLTLTGPNPYSGTTELGGGTLVATTDATALGAGALTLDTPSTILELDNDASLSFGRNTTISASMTIKSGRLTPGWAVTHSLGTLSIGANQLSVAAGSNITNGAQGLAFAPVTQTGAAVYDLGAGTLLTLGSLNQGGFSSTFQNTGSAAVTGPLSGSGGMTVNSATLYLGNTAGTSTSSGAVSVTGGGVLDLGTLPRHRKRSRRCHPQRRHPPDRRRQPGCCPVLEQEPVIPAISSSAPAAEP